MVIPSFRSLLCAHLQAAAADPVVEQQAVAGVAAGVEQDGAEAVREHQGIAQPPRAHVLGSLVSCCGRFALALRMLSTVDEVVYDAPLQGASCVEQIGLYALATTGLGSRQLHICCSYQEDPG